MEAVKWVLADLQEDHDWISELSLALQENKKLLSFNCYIDVPCVVQWKLLWFSAPTSLNNDFLNDGVILEKYDETVNMSCRSAYILLYGWMNTPRACFTRTILEMLGRRTAPARETKGWELGRPDPLPENEDDGQDIEPEVF